MKKLIVSTFEKLECEGVEKIIEGFVAAGLERFEDIEFATENDLKDSLKPIQFRKLMKAYKNAGMYIAEIK